VAPRHQHHDVTSRCFEELVLRLSADEHLAPVIERLRSFFRIETLLGSAAIHAA
jgi:hypothetical protein